MKNQEQEQLTQEKALNIMIQALQQAQKRGAFEFEEAEIILQAIRLFTTPAPNNTKEDMQEVDNG